MDIKFGLKLWSTNTDLIDEAAQLIDEKIFNFIELFVVPDTQITQFLIDVPYIIHIPHHKFGVNIGEGKIKKYNLDKINESIKWADELKAKYLILHAGDGSMEHAADLLHELTDSRIQIENMPQIGLNGEKMIGHSPEQIRDLINNNEMGLCLDFGHAVKAAASLGVNYKNFINQFLNLNPKIFHLCDGFVDYERDEHLNIGKGCYDFDFLINCVERNNSKLITLETPRINQKSLKEDTENIDKLKKIIKLNNNY